ncbi:MAG: hypothetical protein ACR2NO_09895 [Chloroflexota bacterium]
MKEIGSDQEIVAREEPDDPPDFWLSVAGDDYAVEVTSVAADVAYDAQCRELSRAVEREASRGGVLAGTYAVCVARKPAVPPRMGKPWRQLVSSCVEAVADLSGATPGVSTQLLGSRAGSLSVTKVSDSGAAVGLLRTPEAKWEGEVREELARLFQRAVDEKRSKIERKSLGARARNVILAFYDAYAYADTEHAWHALRDVSGYDWFHSVFWAASFHNRPNQLYPDSPGRSGAFFFSRNEAWR